MLNALVNMFLSRRTRVQACSEVGLRLHCGAVLSTSSGPLQGPPLQHRCCLSNLHHLAGPPPLSAPGQRVPGHRGGGGGVRHLWQQVVQPGFRHPSDEGGEGSAASQQESSRSSRASPLCCSRASWVFSFRLWCRVSLASAWRARTCCPLPHSGQGSGTLSHRGSQSLQILRHRPVCCPCHSGGAPWQL